MVLRGSKTHPDQADVLDVQHHIHQLRELLNNLQSQETNIEHELAHIISEASHLSPSNQQEIEDTSSTQSTFDQITSSQYSSELSIPSNLSESIQVLIDRLEYLEKKHGETQKELSDSQKELQIIFKQFICGGFAGMTARTTVAPIDRVKLLIQTALVNHRNDASNRGIIETARHEISKGGIRSMWKGNLTNCIRVFPYAALQFSSYERYKSYIVDYCNEHDRNFGFVERLLSGACAGATAATVTYPLDIMRVRQAVFDDIKGPLQAIQNIYAEGGIRCFYKGWTPTLISLAPFIATNFATFDALKAWYIGEDDPRTASTLAILGLGACAGLFAQSICYPLDTVRRSMQMPKHTYKGVIDCFVQIAKSPNGLKSFYRGLLPNAIKIVPNNGIRFLIYSKLTDYLEIPQKKIRPSSKKNKD